MQVRSRPVGATTNKSMKKRRLRGAFFVAVPRSQTSQKMPHSTPRVAICVVINFRGTPARLRAITPIAYVGRPGPDSKRHDRCAPQCDSMSWLRSSLRPNAPSTSLWPEHSKLKAIRSTCRSETRRHQRQPIVRRRCSMPTLRRFAGPMQSWRSATVPHYPPRERYSNALESSSPSTEPGQLQWHSGCSSRGRGYRLCDT
jgi:hypothetical protein